MKRHHRSIPILLALTIVLGMTPFYWRGPVPRGLPFDLLGIVVLAAASIWTPRGGGAKWSGRLLWMACGALAVAAIASAAWIPAWIVLGVLGLVAGGIRWGPTPWPSFVKTLGLIGCGALINTYILGACARRTPLSADPAAYRAVDLRVHSFLDDVPLRDVWVIDLPGGGENLGILDLRGLPGDGSGRLARLLPGALSAVRLAVGWVLRWDCESAADSSASYMHRLTEEDRERCVGECGGDRAGPFGFRALYTFHREIVYEVQNRTAHAFVAMAMVPVSGGYRLLVGIYVKRTSWFTPVYMATIDPFRRLVVYPFALRSLQRRWAARWGR